MKTTSKARASAKATMITVVPNARGGWSLDVNGVTKGTLTITYQARNKAGNTSAAPVYRQTITR